MLRLMIGTGVLLMTVGFGAAGWQYWQSLPKTAANPVETVAVEAGTNAPVKRIWLASPTGGVVPPDDARVYLEQGRFVPGRTVVVRRQANLSELLAKGEKLPEPAYLEVLADIRAPRVADGLCETMRQSIAADCAVNSARVVADSVDLAAGTAMFELELVYRLKDSEAEVPDLAAHVLRTELLQIDLEAGAEGTASAESALDAAIAAATAACAGEGVGLACRPLRLGFEWSPGQPVTLRAEIGWLDPLPKGMYLAPTLEPAKAD